MNKKYCLLRDPISIFYICISKAHFLHSAERNASHPWASFLSTYQIIYYYQHNCRWFRSSRSATIIFPFACKRIAGVFVQCHCGFDPFKGWSSTRMLKRLERDLGRIEINFINWYERISFALDCHVALDSSSTFARSSCQNKALWRFSCFISHRPLLNEQKRI